MLGRTPETGPCARGSRRFRPSGVLASVALLLLLVPAETTHASQDQEAVTRSSAAPNERPAWLRPLGDEDRSGTDYKSGPSALPGEEDSGALRPGWSKLEPSVLDIQAWGGLQQDLERMFDATRPAARNRLSRDAFEAKYLGATVEFLKIDAEATTTFETAVNKALDEIEAAHTDMLRPKPKSAPDLDENAAMLASRAGWAEYGHAQRNAARHPLAVLEARPRHELLREQMLTWLLRLDYGMGAAAR